MISLPPFVAIYINYTLFVFQGAAFSETIMARDQPREGEVSPAGQS